MDVLVLFICSGCNAKLGGKMSMSKFLKIGSYTSKLMREYYRQGWIFKDEEAFLNRPDAVCYVPELSDTPYTRKDFVELCNGQEDLAADCFEAVDWQCPETWVDEQYRDREWGWCPRCQKIYTMEGEACPCPVCGFTPE